MNVQDKSPFRDDTIRDTNQGTVAEPVAAASSRDTNDEAGDVSSVADRQSLAEEAEKKVGDAPSRHWQQASATFTNRRDAEMALEQIIQEYGLDAGAVEILPETLENSVGTERSGSDIDHASDPANDPKLAGRLIVTVKIGSLPLKKVRSVFTEHGGENYYQI